MSGVITASKLIELLQRFPSDAVLRLNRAGCLDVITSEQELASGHFDYFGVIHLDTWAFESFDSEV